MGARRPGPDPHRLGVGYLTGVVTLAWLSAGSGSGAALVAEAPFVTVPFLVVTFTVSTSETDAPDASVPVLHLTVPLAPTAGFVHEAPAGATSFVNSSPDGSASTIVVAGAAPGPAFKTVIVYVRLPFGFANFSLTPIDTFKSACDVLAPVSPIVCGLPTPLLVIVSMPLEPPGEAEAVYLSVTEQVLPGLSDNPEHPSDTTE